MRTVKNTHCNHPYVICNELVPYSFDRRQDSQCLFLVLRCLPRNGGRWHC